MKPRLLAVELHHLGDAVIALPALRAASRTHDVHILCRTGPAQIFRLALPGATILSCDGGWRELHRRVPALGAGDTAVCAWPDPRAHWLLKCSGAGCRIGVRLAPQNFYGYAHWRRRLRYAQGRVAQLVMQIRGPLLTREIDRPETAPVHYNTWAEIARVHGTGLEASFPWLRTGALPARASALIERARAAGRPVWAVHAGARHPGKRWPLERHAALLRDFFEPAGVAVIVLTGPGEPTPQTAGDWQTAVVPQTVGELAAVLAGVDGALCNDSLASHLAAAMGKPVVTVFGSGDPAWFAPYANGERVLATRACPHRPCVDRCVQPSFVCVDSVGNDLVEKALKDAIVRTGPQRGVDDSRSHVRSRRGYSTQA